MTRGVVPLFFVSGAVALVYEVLWIRDLGTVFGASSAALSAVVSAFLTGLALGAWWAGRAGWGRRRGLWTYALLEFGIAVSAPWVPSAVRLVDRTVLDPSWQFLDQHSGVTAARFTVVFLLLLLPTAGMGASLPVLCTASRALGHRSGEIVGRLYGWNTLGGVVGCLLAGTVLLERVGMHKGLLFAACGNLGLGLLALWLGRGVAQDAEGDAEEHVPRKAVAAGAVRVGSGSGWVLAASFLSSSVAIGIELSWTRLVALSVGGTAYAFSLVLAVYLGGLGVGAVLLARVLRVRPLGLRGFAAVQAVLALLLLGSIGFYDDAARIAGVAIHDAGGDWLARTGISALLCVGVVGLPSLLLGVAFPLLAEIYVPDRAEVGRGVGALYVASTLGGIVGAVLVTYFVQPVFGLERSFVGLAFLTLGFAAVLWVVLPPLSLARVSFAAVLLLAGAALGGGPAVWRALGSSGPPSLARAPWQERDVYSGLFLYGDRALGPSRVLLEHTDGTSCSVAVFRQREDVSLAVNGKVDASSSGDMGTQLLLAWLPQLLHPDPQRVFVLGWGAGVTAGAAAEYGSQVVCAEIEPAVLAASHYFAEANFGAAEHPRVRAVVDDGRSVLRRSRERYQVITTEPSNPWMSGMSSLFTDSFYRLCRDRLEDDGVLCQWVQLYWSAESDYRSILATLHEVFPHLLVFQSTFGDTLMLASPRPLDLDWARIGRAIEERPRVAAALQHSFTGLDGSLSSTLGHLSSRVVLAGDDMARYLDRPAPRITDDRPFLEYSAARRMQVESGNEILSALYAHRRPALYGEESLRPLVEPRHLALGLRYLGIELLRLDQPQAAIQVLDEVAALAPALPEIGFQRWVATLRARTPGALEEWPRMVAAQPSRATTVVEELHRLGERDACRRLVEELRSRPGSQSLASLVEFRLAVAEQDLDQARSLRERLAQASVPVAELADVDRRLEALEQSLSR